MSTQVPLSAHGQMLMKLIETNLTLSRLLEREMALSSHCAGGAGPAPTPGSHPAAPQLSDEADPPIEPTGTSMTVDDTQVREPDVYPFSFDPVEPGTLGAAIVKIAKTELGRPVKEQYVNGNPTNVDDGGHIKKYFIEGPRWKSETWESYKAKHGAGPAWCAAFASFCWRTACHNVGVELPVALNAQCSVLMEQAKKTGRFIPKDGTPSPGDIVFLGTDTPGHVGLVERKDASGIIYIIEGNAGEHTDQLCSSRLIPGKPRYAKLLGFLAAESVAK